eukprot:TRINITY_DN23398_c0_g1_i1.p1 TRINITY_DN23398_c0_g1~~TRINITY_DN23398_c0_g1_i1.p1  ORF type:complete len:180 (-),score=38.45 TRINITY_DN23398_c0_g1_i1:159-698(-)
MDRMDMEMQQESNSPTIATATTTDQTPSTENNSAYSLLASARQHVAQGNPSFALQAVMMAMRLLGGEHAVSWTLQRARQLYQNRIRENAAAEELAAMFAECAIAEASPNSPIRPMQHDNASQLSSSMRTDATESSILAESGRTQIVLDAAADGSSFICLNCGGLVSKARKEEHFAYWCG